MTVNQVTLIGNIGADAELQTTPTGTPYTYARMATNEHYKDKQGNWQVATEWHKLKIWGKSSNRAAQALLKGKKVYIQGQLRSHTNQDKIKTWEIRVETWILLDREDKFLPPEPQASWQNNHNPSPFGEGFTRR